MLVVLSPLAYYKFIFRSWPRQGLQSTSLCMLLTMIALMWTCAGAQDSDCTYTHVNMRRCSRFWLYLHSCEHAQVFKLVTTAGPPKHIFVHAADHDCTHVNMRRCSRFWLYIHSCEHAQVFKLVTTAGPPKHIYVHAATNEPVSVIRWLP